jgi:hypothetical protein
MGLAGSFQGSLANLESEGVLLFLVASTSSNFTPDEQAPRPKVIRTKIDNRTREIKLVCILETFIKVITE